LQKNRPRLIRGPGPSGSHPGCAVRTLRGLLGLSTPFRHHPHRPPRAINRSPVAADNSTPNRSERGWTRSGCPGIDIISRPISISRLYESHTTGTGTAARSTSDSVTALTAHWIRSALLDAGAQLSPPHVRELPQKHRSIAASKALSTAKAGDWPRQAFQGKQGRSILDAMRPAQPQEVKQGSVRRV